MFTLGILTVSDRGSRGEREDESGKVIGEILATLGARLVKYEVVPDEREVISGRLEEWVDREGIDLIVTTGGTGLSPRDVTPEATLAVVDRMAPGFAEVMRAEEDPQGDAQSRRRRHSGAKPDCESAGQPHRGARMP
jgi:molybdopterin adenylyltransferase